MKDLYTFDHSQEEALRTYSAVRRGYSEFFDEFKIPYVVAEADSGSIGGNLSHEYHFPTPKGEDNVISCDKCDYVANEELARTDTPILQEMAAGHSGSMKRIYECRQSSGSPNYHDIPEHMRTHIQSWYGISDNGKVLFQAILPATKCLDRENRTREARVNPYAIKSVFPDADLRVESQNIVFGNFDQLVRVFDYRVSDSIATAYNEYFDSIAGIPFHLKTAEITSHLDVTRIDSGDLCPVCTTGTLRVQTAVELGHTFFLGTRYSEPLQASIASGHENLRSNETSEKAITDMETLSPNSSTTAIQMGCHGIGVSRIIAAVADSLADETGLNWPRVMAPFEVVVIPANGLEDDALEVLSRLDRDENTTTSQRKSHLDISAIDAILDDRKKDMSWKLKDADLIGYPVIIVLGRAWRKGRVCEVQCRRLKSLKVDVHVEQLNEFVSSLLDQL
ncbi:prolyl-tRNA synthetase [Varicellaria rhodocarpa]|nr:prolyl-tRNA synthetase [Varicellaria rhodocarpa]